MNPHPPHPPAPGLPYAPTPRPEPHTTLTTRALLLIAWTLGLLSWTAWIGFAAYLLS